MIWDTLFCIHDFGESRNQLTRARRPVGVLHPVPLGRQKAIAAKSSYVNSLDAEAKRRYCEKLSSVGLSTTDDPYLPANVGKYANDVAQN